MLIGDGLCPVATQDGVGPDEGAVIMVGRAGA